MLTNLFFLTLLNKDEEAQGTNALRTFRIESFKSQAQDLQ